MGLAAPFCVGNKSNEVTVGPRFAACAGDEADRGGLVLDICANEADGIELGALLALKEGNGGSAELKLGPMMRDRDGALLTARGVGRSVGTPLGSAVG
jgi:hypothetical protein